MAYTGSTAAILSNYDEALKTFYLPAIQEQLNQDTILADMIDTNEEDVSGKEATIECHYGRTKGTGARPDGGALPDADYQKFKTAEIPMKYIYGRITVSGPTIAATRDERGSYAKALDTEIAGVVTDLKKEVNRMLWGAGYGVLSRWNTGTVSTVTVQKRYTGNTAAGGGDGFGSTFGAKYHGEGRTDLVEVIVSGLSSQATSSFVTDTTDLVVTGVTEGTNYDTITITAPGTMVTGSWFVRPGSLAVADAAAGAHRYEMMGISGIVDDRNLDEINVYNGTDDSLSTAYVDGLQGLAVGTYTWWKAIVDAHAGGRYSAQRALTFTLMQKVFDKVEEAAGKDYGPNLILTTRAIRREYLELCQADRRYVNTMELDGGWTAIDYNGVPFTVDNDAIDGNIFFLTTSDLQIYRMADYDWMQKDGAVLSRITNYDAYEAVLYRYAELGCTRRNAQGLLADLSYSL